ncbi:response regulator [Thermoflexibacter ruber]|uniref:histidine kinase n=1 Tax=Thermoflexibacter ruber TaxID=1003 RepID=A0A1I2HPB8_9BACT|nr:response regulator [Thermoflexibacter ruber]SFF31368.1 His Kinase A (phospho-acceptor) domain-containing protein [Thermoflexibacter ruber]
MKTRILIVDDEKHVIRQVGEMLQKFGYEYGFIPKANFLFQRIENENFDLILLDIYMPEEDGISLLQAVKEHPRYQHVPVIMMTNETDDKVLAQCFAIGASDYITKPIKEEVFKARIKSVIDNQNYIREIQKKTAQLIQAEKMASLGQLTAGIAHEINNPINFIYAGINALKLNFSYFREVIEEYEKLNQAEADYTKLKAQLAKINSLKEELEFDRLTHDIQRLINSIEKGAERTAEIIKGLRSFSKVEDSHLQIIDIHENIDTTLLLLQSQYQERIQIVKSYGNLPQIECYPSKLNQLFMNILSNAIQSIENQGTIWIKTTKEREGHVVIYVKDTGAGMNEESQQRIFEPLFSLNNNERGIGLSLSIAQSIVEQHHGNIFITSELGKGTEFKISLPIRQSI